MKKLLSVILISALSIGIFSSCDTAYSAEMGEYFTGEQIELTASVTGKMGNGEDAQLMVNNIGMSGMYASNQLHDNDTDGMYVTKDGATDVCFTFEAEQAEPIGRVYLWNYCEKNNLSAGLNKVTVSYSVDGKEYTELGVYEIEIGDPSGEESYSAMVDFNGVTAKYIRITPEETDGNHGDKKGRYGLAEIRVFRFKTHPGKKGDVIVSSYEETDNNSVIENPENTANNSGMSGSLSKKDTHSNDPADMALMDITAGNRTFVFDLDGNYPIDKMYVYNYNDPDNLDAALKNVKIYYSTNGTTFILLKDKDENREHILTQPDGKDNMSPTDVIDFGGIHASKIKIEVDRREGNYGDEKNAGLSEVRFTCGKGYAIEPARDWTGLFSRSDGWLAADGIFTINLNGYDVQGSANEDTKTLFIFSDTAVGTVDYSNMSVDRSDFYNHTFAYFDGTEPNPKKLKFVLSNPSGGNLFKDAIWLGDLVRLNDKDIRLSGFKFNSSWGADRMDLCKLIINDKTGYLNLSRISKTEDVPLKYVNGKNEVMMYSGILNESKETGNPKGDGYIYLYGFRNHDGFKKNLVVARTLPENFDKIAKWEYYNGEEWLEGIENANTKDAYISNENISSELSVTKMTSGMFKNKYMLVYTDATMSPYIKMAVSDKPEGPFEDAEFIYYCPEEKKYREMGDEGIYTYNCKAHPHLSKKGELLISYNVNSTTNYNEDTYRYYPQFIKMYEIK